MKIKGVYSIAKDSLQKRLQEMERESPSPSLEGAKPTLSERAGFLARYFSGAVEQVPQKSFVEYTLRDILYGSRATWIESYAKGFAEEEATDIQAEHYKKAVRELGDAFLINESDTRLRNLFSSLKMIAHRGRRDRNSVGYSRHVFSGISPEGVHYSVKYQMMVGGDDVSVTMGNISFTISDRPELSHYGSEIPEDILTQILDGRVDEGGMTGIERDYTETYRAGTGGSPADPKQEFWARLFPGSIRAAAFDDKHGTNYSGRSSTSRNMSARDVWKAKWEHGRFNKR